MRRGRMIIIVPVLLAGITIHSRSQSFELTSDSALFQVSGTSTLHDWKMQLEAFDCKADFVLNGSQLRSVGNIIFQCRSTDLKSESSLMDRKAHSAMKADENPDISFRMPSVMAVTTHSNDFTDDLNGILRIAGQSKPVTIHFHGTSYERNGTVIVNIYGSTELKMSDFGIAPPVLMMGALKTGDTVKISFSLQFREKSMN